MWVVVRLLVAAVVGLIRFFWRKTAVEKADASAGIPWVLHQSRSKRRVTTTWFGVAVASPLFVTFTREGKLDWFFKAHGLSHEIQTGDAAFDDEVYIACDHPVLPSILRDNRAARRAILGLLNNGVTRIYTDGAHLWAKRDGDHRPTNDDVASLETIAVALRSVSAERVRLLGDPFFWKALLVESIVWSIAFYGVPGIVEFAVVPYPHYFDWAGIIELSIVAAIAMFAALFGLTWLVLRGSSRAHRIFVESALVLIIGVPLSTFVIVSDANIQFDQTPATVVQSVIQERYTTRTHSRSGTHTHYHLALETTTDAPVAIPRGIEVPYSVYAGATRGGKLDIRIRPGALRVPWVESISLATE